MAKPKKNPSVDVPRQSENMNIAMAELELMSLQEVARLLRLAPISVYRMVAKRLLPVYRFSRRMRFAKKDVIAYLESQKTDTEVEHGGS